MLYRLILPIISMLLLQIACGGGLTRGIDMDAKAEGASTLQSKEGDAQGQTVQLAQYPGAPVEDSAGNLWFGTVTKGLIRYDGKKFTAFSTEQGLPSNTIRGLVWGADGALWIATTGGVCVYDGSSFRTLTDYGDIPVKHTFGGSGDHRDVWDLLCDSQGTWWIATLAGVFRYDGKMFKPFALPVIAAEGDFEFAATMVYEIYEAKDGALWFGTDGAGAVRFDGTEMVVYTEKEHGLCSDRVCVILEDSRGDFWFGTSTGGVSRYDGKSFSTHLRSETFSKHTGWGRYMSILEDRKGHVWFGVCSEGGGVHRFDGEDFRYFSQKEGLGKGGVPSIRLDRSGSLWLGTTSGVYRYIDGRFVNFTMKG